MEVAHNKGGAKAAVPERAREEQARELLAQGRHDLSGVYRPGRGQGGGYLPTDLYINYRTRPVSRGLPTESNGKGETNEQLKRSSCREVQPKELFLTQI